MPRRLATLAVLAAVALASSGCATVTDNAATRSLPPVGGQPLKNTPLGIGALKILIDLNAGFNAATEFYQLAVDNHQLKPAVQATVKDKLIKFSHAIDAAHHAYMIGNSANFGAQVGAARTLRSDIQTFFPTPG